MVYSIVWSTVQALLQCMTPALIYRLRVPGSYAVCWLVSKSMVLGAAGYGKSLLSEVAGFICSERAIQSRSFTMDTDRANLMISVLALHSCSMPFTYIHARGNKHMMGILLIFFTCGRIEVYFFLKTVYYKTGRF